MADENSQHGEQSEEPVRFTDKRRIDPETGEPRGASGSGAAEGEATAEDQEPARAGDHLQNPLEHTEEILEDLPVEDAEDVETLGGSGESEVHGSAGDPDGVVAEAEQILGQQGQVADAPVAEGSAREAELENDLRRVQAEYVNYRRRVERDRAVERDRTAGDLLSTLMPVLDDLHAARQAGDLGDGPFAAIAKKLETTLEQQGLERIEEVGAAFDPTVHEAVMQQPHQEIDADHVAVVIRPGYRHGERVLRAAQVVVSSGAAE